jgi:hypothetical protein
MAQTRIIRVCVVIGAIGLAAAMSAWAESRMVVARGTWVLLQRGAAAPIDGLRRGLQTSGLAWDGNLLWSVGDQRASFPGNLYAIDPQSGRLVRAPIPLVASDAAVRAQLDVWSKVDLEDIAVIPGSEHRFVAVVEDEATAALAIRLDNEANLAVVTAIWEFQFPSDDAPAPYRNDPNYRLEGIAVDDIGSRGYVAFERDERGVPHLYQFALDKVPGTGIARVQLESLRFTAWNQLRGKPGALLNANGLQFTRTASGAPRLWVICRDREMFFVMDPASGELTGQVELSLQSPDGEPIEWVSPEGIAVDSDRCVVYIISDPDSTDGNYRLRKTPSATSRFAEYVPLLFELKMPSEAMR